MAMRPRLRLDVLSRHVADVVRPVSLSYDLVSANDVVAEFNYGSPTAGVSSVKRCPVANGRSRDHTVEEHGFTLSTIRLEQTQGVDLYDISPGSAALYPLVEEVLRKLFPDSTRILVFDHILRNLDRSMKEASRGGLRTPMLDTGYGHQVHGDYTARSGFSRLRQLLVPYESEANIERAMGDRFAFINVWVPLRPVLRDPLALLEWDSQSPQDVVTIRLTYQHREGEVYRVLPSESHRWVYYPEMQPGECLAFKVFDSATDGRARFSLHSAFELPNTASDTPCRESVEVRCAVLFCDGGAALAPGFVAPHLKLGSPDRIDDPPLKVVALPPGTTW